MRPTGDIPPAPAFFLERDRLVQVLCQVQFSPILRLRGEEAVAGFQDAIRGVYPEYRREEGTTVIVSPQGVQSQPDVSVRHLFGDPDTGHTLIVSTDFLAIDSRSYPGIEAFAERVSFVVDTFASCFSPGKINQIGFRFINEFPFSRTELGSELRRAFAPELLGAVGACELDGVTQGTQQVIDLYGDDSQLLVRHGLSPAGGSTVEAAPFSAAPRQGPQDPYYLLDLDAFAPKSLPFSADGVESVLRTFNDDIRAFFAWSVRGDYREKILGQRAL